MSPPRPAGVSEREAEVLTALGGGLSNAQIARRLHISTRTVEGHVSSLLRKCGVADRRALAALAATTSSATPPGQVAGVPHFRTSFVGRGRECDDVRAALRPGGLVTLVGTGGVGKTRIAAAVTGAAAGTFPFGGAFVDLVPVRPGMLTQAVAAGLGVAGRTQQPLADAVVERLGRGRSLLVLDNCEHLIEEAADLVERALSICPDTAVLVTSRERLGVPGERIVPIAPLPLGTDAERLFRDRAAAVDRHAVADPRIVSDLCARLDGLPLAIELAAARCDSLGAAGLLMGLGDYLRLLAGGRGAVVRHRSLRGVMDWSHDLLSAEEQQLFRRLSMFAGRFDLPAAVTVAGLRDGTGRPGAPEPATTADLLGRLVDKSLVTHEPGRTDRWRMLATIRAFAGDQLDRAGEHAEIQQRHLRWAADTAETMARRSQDRWREEFDAVADDLRAALASTPPEPEDPVPHRLARALGSLTFARRFVSESLGHFRAAAARAPTPAGSAVDLRHAAECAQVLNDSGESFALLLAAAEQAAAAGDRTTRASALARAVELAGRFPVTFRTEVPYDRLRRLLADAEAAAGDRPDGVVAARLACAAAWTASPEALAPDQALAERAVAAARATGDPVVLSASLDAVRTAAVAAGRDRDAHRVTTQRLALIDQVDPSDPYAAPEVEDTLGLACSDAVAAGDLPAAMSAVRRLLDDDLLGDHPYLISSKVVPALVLRGDLDLALQHARTMWDGWQRAGRPPAFWMQATVHFVTLAYGLRSDREGLRTWRVRAAEVAGVASPFQPRISPLAAFVEARLAVHTGRTGDATGLVARASARVPRGRYLPYARAAAAELAVVADLPGAADLLASTAPLGDGNAWAAACLARAAGRLRHDPHALAAAAEQWFELGARWEWAATLLLIPDRAADGRAQLATLGIPTPAG